MTAVKRDAAGNDKSKIAEEITPAQLESLQAISKEFVAIEIEVERKAMNDSKQLYEKRRSVLKAIPNFWKTVLLSGHTELPMYFQLEEDQEALSYLEDIWVVRDEIEPRVFTLEFHFKENPYFTDSVLKKVYKYTPLPEKTANTTPDARGILPQAIEFSWEEDVTPQAFQISWKDGHNLTKKYPIVVSEADDDEGHPEEHGTFFNFFESAKDYFDIGLTIGTSVFPEAIEFFLKGDEDLTDSEEEDADEDDDEIDLEAPKKKKVKRTAA